MARRKPLVMAEGQVEQLQLGDTLDSTDATQDSLDDLTRKFSLLLAAWVMMGFPIPPGLEADAVFALNQ